MELPDRVITSLIFFDICPTKDAVADTFEEHIWPLFRCSSRVADGHFVKVEEPMDRSYHFAEQAVEEEAGIDEFAQKVMMQPLDRGHPLWRVVILRSKRGRSAVLIQIHHVISDGLGLLFAFLPTMSCESGKVIDHIPLPAILLGKKMSRKSVVTKKNPFVRLCNAFLASLSAVVAFFRGILSLVIVGTDSSIAINAPPTERRPLWRFKGTHTFTRMPSVPLSLVDTVRKKHACTVNDVLMCGLAGAIRRYSADDLCDPLFKQPKKLECKCTMLMGLARPVDQQNPDPSMRNNILTPIVRLPIGEPSAVSRLRRTIAIMGDLKSAAFMAGIHMTSRLVSSIAPVFVFQQLGSDVLSKLTANVSSMPMATVPIKMFGQEVKEVQALFVNPVPQICMVSYNGSVHWNIICDPRLIPQPRALGKHLISELEELASSPA